MTSVTPAASEPLPFTTLGDLVLGRWYRDLRSGQIRQLVRLSGRSPAGSPRWDVQVTLRIGSTTWTKSATPWAVHQVPASDIDITLAQDAWRRYEDYSACHPCPECEGYGDDARGACTACNNTGALPCAECFDGVLLRDSSVPDADGFHRCEACREERVRMGQRETVAAAERDLNVLRSVAALRSAS